jgi:hypothetical protein
MKVFKPGITFLGLFAVACSTGETEPAGEAEPVVDVDTVFAAGPADWGTDTTTIISFEDVTIQISRLAVYDEQGILEHTINGDSVQLWIEVGEGIEGKQIAVSGPASLLKDVKVEQRYETSVTASAEGPHCDLIDWKHYTSEWKVLETSGLNKFTADVYTPEMTQQFPEVSIDEVKTETERACEGWGEVVHEATSITDYPFSVGISRIWLRITAERSDTGEKIEKIIEFGVPMGC